MRLAPLYLASVLLATGALAAQQAPVSVPSAAAPSTESQTSAADAAPVQKAAAEQSSQLQDDPIARGQAKAAERTGKDQAKADAKARKDAEKQKKQEEADAKLLKLEDNEIAISVFDDQGNPVKIPPCAKKDKSCQEKRKELLKQKRVELNVQNGTLTIDGLIARARLNYDISSYLYLYISIPGYGTVVTSPVHFPYSTEAKDALTGNTLSFQTTDDHLIELASEKQISGRGKRSIFYSVDRVYQQPGRYPTIGYGTVSKAPYMWPGAAPLTEDQKRHLGFAPDLPKGMSAQVAEVPCQSVPAGGTVKPVKVDGRMVLPKACKTGESAAAAGSASPSAHPVAKVAEAGAPSSTSAATVPAVTASASAPSL